MTTSEPVQANLPVNISTESASQGRILSVDALRGFDMFWIIGAGALSSALDKIAAGNPVVAAVVNQLTHVPWEGFRFYDLIFPLFVFIMGVSIVLSLSKRLQAQSRSAVTLQVFRRSILLYLLGLFALGGIERGIENLRLLGVLQRIALCYLFASLAFIYLKPKQLPALCATLLLAYWAMMTFIPVPGVGTGDFEEGKNLANYIDAQYLPLFKWDGDHDPEGILSTLPAIGTALLGIFAGLLLQNPHIPDNQKVRRLLTFGVAGIGLGYAWSLQFPIVKKIWTSSFVLVAGGWSAILLALFYWIIDVKKHQRWAGPFFWIGTNAITIYIAVRMVPMPKMAERIAGGEIKAWLNSFHNGLGDLLIAVIILSMAILFCRYLYRRRIFLRV